jgi:pimeloyl-ACP methyl ester carboxylesterase
MPPKRPSAPNPVEYTYTHPKGSSVEYSIPHPEPISTHSYHIAGILVHVHGLDELPANSTQVATLFLLHPRLQTAACMVPFAAHIITNYYAQEGPTTTGLIAVSFDQRNHGTRLVDELANEAWRTGNDRHAIDMFSQFAGTAVDASVVLDYLAGYIFPEGERTIVKNMVMGVSLGGHAVWHLLMRDHRFDAAIVVVGCPDYTRLMADRARLSKRKTWLEGQGREFLGSRDWPASLMAEVERRDPAGVVTGVLARGSRPGEESWEKKMSADEMRRLRPEMEKWFGGKRVLLLSGGADKLVSYKFSEPFVTWLKSAVAKDGWFADGDVYLKDVVYEGIGHEVPPEMVQEMLPFINDSMREGDRKQRRSSRL